MEAGFYAEQALQVGLGQTFVPILVRCESFQRGSLEESRGYLGRYMRSENPSAEALWLGVRTERLLGDRGVAASYAAQLCRRYADSQECQALKSGAQK